MKRKSAPCNLPVTSIVIHEDAKRKKYSECPISSHPFHSLFSMAFPVPSEDTKPKSLRNACRQTTEMIEHGWNPSDKKKRKCKTKGRDSWSNSIKGESEQIAEKIRYADTIFFALETQEKETA